MQTRDALRPEASEAEHQRHLISWVRLMQRAHPVLRLLYAVPNGGKRDEITAKLMVAEGTLAGVPDLCLPAARGPFHGLYMELKRPGNTKRPAPQRAFVESLQAEGYRASFVVGWTAARDEILAYLALGPFRGADPL